MRVKTKGSSQPGVMARISCSSLVLAGESALTTGRMNHHRRPVRGISGTFLAGLWVECVTLYVHPGAGSHRFRPGPKCHFEHTAPMVAKEGSHHSIRQTGMFGEPGRQVLDQFYSCLSVSLFDSEDELPHSFARSTVSLFMPAQCAVSGRTHQSFLVGK